MWLNKKEVSPLDPGKLEQFKMSDKGYVVKHISEFKQKWVKEMFNNRKLFQLLPETLVIGGSGRPKNNRLFDIPSPHDSSYTV